MSTEQKIRAILFYIALSIFLIGLPFILSFALGYKFNRHTLKFTKAGLIVLKTQPAQADIYLEEKPLDKKTPDTIYGLLPGKYRIRIELENHYPWVNDVIVEAGKVTLLDRIILFPVRPNIKQVNKEKLSLFWIDEEKDNLYSVNPEDNFIYKLDLNGEHPQKLAEYLEISPPAIKYKLSANRERLLYFNLRKVAIISLSKQGQRLKQDEPFILSYPQERIIDVFWHSDNYHIILVTNKDIKVQEALADSSPISMVVLNKSNTLAFYDIGSDTLYFLDSQQAADGRFYDNLYKLELSTRLFPFQEFIKFKPSEREE